MAIKFMCRLLKQHSWRKWVFIGTLRSIEFSSFRHFCSLLLLYICVLYFFYYQIKITDVFKP